MYSFKVIKSVLSKIYTNVITLKSGTAKVKHLSKLETHRSALYTFTFSVNNMNHVEFVQSV